MPLCRRDRGWLHGLALSPRDLGEEKKGWCKNRLALLAPALHQGTFAGGLDRDCGPKSNEKTRVQEPEITWSNLGFHPSPLLTAGTGDDGFNGGMDGGGIKIRAW